MGESAQVKTIDFLNTCHSSNLAFSMMYNTDPKKFKSLFGLARADLIQALLERNQDALERLDKTISQFPTLLRIIEAEFKKRPEMA